jgi:hypothetical protein
MLDKVKDTFEFIGDKAIAVGEKVGMKRGLIGLAILVGATAGAIVAVKLIRSRRADADEHDLGEELAEPGVRVRRGKKRGHANGASAGAH